MSHLQVMVTPSSPDGGNDQQDGAQHFPQSSNRVLPGELGNPYLGPVPLL